MTAPEQSQVEIALQQIQDPYLKQDLMTAGVLKEIRTAGDKRLVVLEFPYPCAGKQDDIRQQVKAALGEDTEVEISTNIQPHAGQHQLPNMAQVKNIVAVASGKGGVGKSTTTVNLALAMAAEGAKVGIMDADIYGPSQGLMLGVEGKRPEPVGDKHMKPVVSHGIQSMSMSYLIDENTPMVWRGPMVAGALQQLMTQTLWEDLDYLFVDMPPGTGDVQLTLSQKVPVAGAVVVTTPQDIALLDAKKGVEMFRKVDIPVLGVVENMSTHICSNCGHIEHIFGEGGGERISEQYDTELLGNLPLSLSIRQQVDAGHPTVLSDPDSAEAELYRDIARKVGAVLAIRGKAAPVAFPNISVEED
ncbi:iron-sulfur cluster carrier protein ApbC [Pontibacterium granulatum]|nr:iron-sulfur cluster carrier protein ApbC [Pontibacterium granulatum]MDI3325661.1 iron-sulfur cluster carrier protein ApbC [Pontibacterium granulatum]